MHVWTFNQSINQSTLFKHSKWLSKLVFRHAITWNLITHTLTMYHVKLTLRTALGQKHFDLQSLSPTLRNLLVINLIAVGF